MQRIAVARALALRFVHRVARSSVGAIAALLAFTSLAGAQVPPNDACANALEITTGTIAGTNVGATKGTLFGSCSNVQHDVWYRTTPLASGKLRVDLCGGAAAPFNAMLAAFRGGCASAQQVACSKDACSFQPQITFDVVAGETYWIEVGSEFVGATGAFQLHVEFFAPVVNDECATALAISAGDHFGHNVGATNSGVPTSCSGFGSDVWYTYTTDCVGLMRATIAPPLGFTFGSFTGELAIFKGTCGALVPVDCKVGASSPSAYAVQPGETFYFALGGLSGSQGAFKLHVECTAFPTNDECANATTAVDGVTHGSSVGATKSASPAGCPGAANGVDVWYRYTAPSDGYCSAQISSATVAWLAVFDGACGALAPLVCDTNSGFAAQFPVSAGQALVLRVGAFTQGPFDLALHTAPTPSNDTCAGALELVEGPLHATLAGTTPSCDGGVCNDIWFHYVPQHTGLARLRCCGPGTSSSELQLAVREGACDSTAFVPLLAYVCQTTAQHDYDFAVQAGHAYLLAIGASYGTILTSGSFDAVLEAYPQPANDECAGALPLALGVTEGSNLVASDSSGGAGALQADVWYALAPPCKGMLRVVAGWSGGGVAAFGRLPALRVFSGTCAALQPEISAYGELTLAVDPATPLWLAVGSEFEPQPIDVQGAFTLDVQCEPFDAHWRVLGAPASTWLGGAASWIDGRVYTSHALSLFFGTCCWLDTRVHAFDPASESWSVVGPQSQHERWRASGIALGHRYAVLGGFESGNGSTAFEAFDPATSTWSALAPLPTPRGGFGCVELDGRIHALGGWSREPFTSAMLALASHEVYDPLTDAWSALAPLPVAVGDASATLAWNGRIYVFGGATASEVVATTQIYDPATDAWSFGAPLPLARARAAAGVHELGALAGLPIVIGGSIDMYGEAVSARVDAYDPLLDAWTELPSLPAGVVDAAAPAPSTCARIHVIGGRGLPGTLVPLQVLEPLEALRPDACRVSVSAGGTHVLELAAPAALGGLDYVVLGSMSGTEPGVALGGVLVPLNPDAYTLIALSLPDLSRYTGFAGELDAAGEVAHAPQIHVAPSSDPALIGRTFHHAFVAIDTLGPSLVFASNAVPLALVE